MKKPFLIFGSVFIGVVLFKIFSRIATLAIQMNFKYSILFSIIFFIIIIYLGIMPIVKLIKRKYNDKAYSENIPTGFEEIYNKSYEEHLHTLEAHRKKIKFLATLQFIALMAFFVLNIYGNSGRAMVMLFGAIALIIISNKDVSKYNEIYKKEIVGNFVKLINNQLEYQPTSDELVFMEEDYKRAGFDNEWFNRFRPDDYIEGFLDDEVFVKMGDLHIQRHTGSGKNSSTVEIFRGIFAHMASGKDIGTYIKISKNQLKIFGPNNRVEMDSTEFEKYFDIYSDNKMITMQLLTSNIMTTLIDFYNKYNIAYEIVIRNNKIYMRFFTGAMFEPKIFGNSMDKELLLKYYCILKFIVDVTKEVNKALKEVEI